MPDSEEKFWIKQERQDCLWPGTPPTLAQLKSPDRVKQSQAWHVAFGDYCLESTMWKTMWKKSYSRINPATDECLVVYANRLNEYEKRKILDDVIEEIKRKVIDEDWIPPEGQTFHQEIVRITYRLTEASLKKTWEEHVEETKKGMMGSRINQSPKAKVYHIAEASKQWTEEQKEDVVRRVVNKFRERPESRSSPVLYEKAMCWLKQIVYEHKYHVMELSTACDSVNYTGRVRAFVFEIVSECTRPDQ